EFAAELDRQFNHLDHPQIVLSQMNMLGSHDTPRTMTIARNDRTAVRLMFLCQMTVPGAPNLYYGDEIGETGGHDPNSRRAFPWHDEHSWDRSLRAEIRRFIHLRRDTPALRRGNFRVLHVSNNVVVYQRKYQEQMAVVAFNAGTQRETFVCPEDFPIQLPEKLVGHGHTFAAGREMILEPRSGRVWAN
ncbi:MAG TPA: alpha-amylase family glycosyl hydrolase, partial [Anaerolineae bacterium]